MAGWYITRYHPRRVEKWKREKQSVFQQFALQLPTLDLFRPSRRCCDCIAFCRPAFPRFAGSVQLSSCRRFAPALRPVDCFCLRWYCIKWIWYCLSIFYTIYQLYLIIILCILTYWKTRVFRTFQALKFDSSGFLLWAYSFMGRLWKRLKINPTALQRDCMGFFRFLFARVVSCRLACRARERVLTAFSRCHGLDVWRLDVSSMGAWACPETRSAYNLRC